MDKSTADRPHDQDPTHVELTEAALLGAMLLSAAARDGVPRMLDPDDFDRSAHRVLFEVIVAMHAAGDEIDNITVNDKLAATGKLDEIGGLAAVWSLTAVEGCPTPSSWPTYATIVAREARRRRDIVTLRRAIARLEAGEDPAVVAAELEVAA